MHSENFINARFSANILSGTMMNRSLRTFGVHGSVSASSCPRLHQQRDSTIALTKKASFIKQKFSVMCLNNKLRGQLVKLFGWRMHHKTEVKNKKSQFSKIWSSTLGMHTAIWDEFRSCRLVEQQESPCRTETILLNVVEGRVSPHSRGNRFSRLREIVAISRILPCRSRRRAHDEQQRTISHGL